MSGLPQGTSKIILLVDDENSIRELYTTCLQRYGYRVVTVSNGREAVDVYRKSMKDIDLVLMDIKMPALNGIDAQYLIHTINPRAKVLLMSGFPLASLPELTSPRFMQKPIAPEALIAAIEELLQSEQ